MDTRSRGNAAEAAVLAAFATRGYRVLVPFGDAHPYDLAVDACGAFVRVQCKAGWQEGGCVLFNCRSTDHGRGPLPYIGRADVVGVHFAPLDTVYVVPVDAVGSHEGRLRLVPALNNQRRLTRPATDFEIDRLSACFSPGDADHTGIGVALARHCTVDQLPATRA